MRPGLPYRALMDKISILKDGLQTTFYVYIIQVYTYIYTTKKSKLLPIDIFHDIFVINK